MKEYRELIEALIAMSEITRPKIHLNLAKDKTAIDKRSETIQHGICDLMEDAAVAIDDLLSKLKGTVPSGEERTYAEAS